MPPAAQARAAHQAQEILTMPDTPTPGQVAYEAYYADTDLALAHGLLPFDTLPAWQQARWERTAQAVLEMQKGT